MQKSMLKTLLLILLLLATIPEITADNFNIIKFWNL